MNHFKNFVVKNLILTFIFAVSGTILFLTILKSYYHPIYPVVLLIALLINLVLFRLTLTKNKANQTFLVLILSFAIKFFSYLILTIVYFMYQEEMLFRIAYIFVLFIVFIGFTSLELKMSSKFFKSNSNH